ncbi:Hypothetical protein NGAL_HAMBI490_21050 [Neorhizobium galegae bv. officinalis]|nr:Hypothetical protein NGAL_HAMBI490_21050 [Neorhizobium galegae bv. officinalis]
MVARGGDDEAVKSLEMLGSGDPLSTGKHGETALEGVPAIPPSVLPDISPSRGEIGWRHPLLNK